MSVRVIRQVHVSGNHPTDSRAYGDIVLDPVGLNLAHVTVIGNPWAVNLDDLERAIALVREEAKRAGYQS